MDSREMSGTGLIGPGDWLIRGGQGREFSRCQEDSQASS